VDLLNFLTKGIHWIVENKIELFGLISALAYLYFSIKQNVLLWPLGLIASLVYIYIYFGVKLYADMGLQVYYVIISLYGWIYWTSAKAKNNNSELKVQRIDKKTSILLTIITLIIFFAISFILKNFTDASLPYWDAFTTAASISATWMLAKKYIEQWLIWIVVDFVSMIMYIYKDLNITALLFVIYTSMAVIGYIQWNNSYKLSLNSKK